MSCNFHIIHLFRLKSPAISYHPFHISRSAQHSRSRETLPTPWAKINHQTSDQPSDQPNLSLATVITIRLVHHHAITFQCKTFIRITIQYFQSVSVFVLSCCAVLSCVIMLHFNTSQYVQFIRIASIQCDHQTLSIQLLIVFVICVIPISFFS